MTDQILEWRAQSPLSKSTLKMYTRRVRQLKAWLSMRGLQFDDLGPNLFLEYVDERGWANSARRNALSAVRSYLRYLGDYDHDLFELKLPGSKSGPKQSSQNPIAE